MVVEASIDIMKDLFEKAEIDIEDFDIESECERINSLIRDNDGLVQAKQYEKQVDQWMKSLKAKEPLRMEIRFNDAMTSDSFETIIWYQHLFEAKLRSALFSQKEEEKSESKPHDSLGNAKLLLVSVERNINAWSYMYQKFPEDEDEILDILVCLQILGKKVEQMFPDARAFIRPGLDEPLQTEIPCTKTN